MALAVALTAVQACADRHVREAGDMAESFVKAYFAAEYDKAAALCGEELRAKVEESARQIVTLPDSLKSAFLELAAELEPQAGEVYEKLGKNSEALKVYQTIKDKYFNSYNGMNIDKYIERVSE